MQGKIIATCISLFFSLTMYSATVQELLPNERNTVEIFQKFSPKVVYIHRFNTIRKHFTLRKHTASGAGSGIIWDNRGHIVTNFHVVKGADELAVSIGKLTVPAKVIGSDAKKDLAVLQITDKKILA